MSDEVIFKELPETFPKFDKLNSNANLLPAVAPPPSRPLRQRRRPRQSRFALVVFADTAERSTDPGNSDS